MLLCALCLQTEVVYTYVGDIVVSVNPFKNTGGVGKVPRLARTLRQRSLV